eukprot:Platyproteum_vivax@DN12793_c0_g1_i1.p1
MSSTNSPALHSAKTSGSDSASTPLGTGALNKEFDTRNPTEIRNSIMETVYEVCMMLTGDSEPPSEDVGFMELGIDSLGAMEFRSMIANRLGLELSRDEMKAIFMGYTISELVDHIVAQTCQSSLENDRKLVSTNMIVST